jgi:hypothetical protein
MTGKGSRQKGIRFEKEIVDVFDSLGLPSMRVLGSGSFIGAISDVKVGIELNSDGSKPEADEAKAFLRLECKNRASTPDYLWEYLNQDASSKAVALRRKKIPAGALAQKDYNQCYIVLMGASDWVELIKEVIQLRKEVNEVRRRKG